MINLIIFILSCASLTQILCYGKIFKKIRPKAGFFGELLSCSMCTGFHVGWAMFFVFWHFNIILFSNLYLGAFLYALISALCSYILDKFITDNGIAVNITNNAKIREYPYDKWV